MSCKPATEACVIKILQADCKIAGTSCAEFGTGKRVSMRASRGELVEVFHVDDNSNPSCTLRSEIDLSGRICDCIFHYEYEVGKGAKYILCFVELKGRDVSRAVEQLINTFNRIRDRLCPFHSDVLRFKAYIYIGISAPADNKKAFSKLKKRLEDEFGSGNALIRREDDIGVFLRA